MRKILQFKLKVLAKLILKKYRPMIIGITGSLGKTSATHAIHAVVSSKYKTNDLVKNYNNEIGLPLIIIGELSPGRSLLGWAKVMVKASVLAFRKNKDYPQVLILEFGVDRPGDMKYLTDIAKPHIGVVTRIAKSHAEFFGTIEDIKKEKAGLIESLGSDGFVVFNADDELSSQIGRIRKDRLFGYGFDKQAEVRASDLNFNFNKEKDLVNLYGMGYKVKYGKAETEIILPNTVGYQAVYASLAAIGVGLALDLKLEQIAGALKELKLPAGRMSIINGIKETMIIDDSYNSASPESVYMALDVVAKISVDKEASKYAVLGDMLELGAYSEEAHRLVGEYLVKNTDIDYLVTVGEKSKDIARQAKKLGMGDDKILEFNNSEEAGRFLQGKIKSGDLIFVKGSQGIRTERVVKELMANPQMASKLLVRQDKEWLNR